MPDYEPQRPLLQALRSAQLGGLRSRLQHDVHRVSVDQQVIGAPIYTARSTRFPHSEVPTMFGGLDVSATSSPVTSCSTRSEP